jgi:hypothetical protein
MPRTALAIPVPQADGLFQGAPGLPPHVTILFPFAEEPDEPALAELFARFPAFDFALDRIEQFEEGTRWLRPVPTGRFVDLTAAVCQRWPEHPPYEGAFDEVIPHLTITVGDVPGLPIAARAERVSLFEEDEHGAWHERASFPLQGVA